MSSEDYLRGLNEALALARAKPTAFAFSVAAEIETVIDAEHKRLAPIIKERERIRRALAPRGSLVIK